MGALSPTTRWCCRQVQVVNMLRRLLHRLPSMNMPRHVCIFPAATAPQHNGWLPANTDKRYSPQRMLALPANVTEQGALLCCIRAWQASAAGGGTPVVAKAARRAQQAGRAEWRGSILAWRAHLNKPAPPQRWRESLVVIVKKTPNTRCAYACVCHYHSPLPTRPA